MILGELLFLKLQFFLWGMATDSSVEYRGQVEDIPLAHCGVRLLLQGCGVGMKVPVSKQTGSLLLVQCLAGQQEAGGPGDSTWLRIPCSSLA